MVGRGCAEWGEGVQWWGEGVQSGGVRVCTVVG